MVNVKKSALVLKHFVLILTFLALGNTSWAQLEVYKIEGKQININDKAIAIESYNQYVLPFKTHIDEDLNAVLATCPETLDKSKGQWQTTIGDLLADVTLQKANFVFKKRENLDIDICILNHGGIRSILPKGDVTARTAFEIMPFENSMVVIALKGTQIIEMVDFLIADKKAHPLAGITFTIDKNNQSKNILVQGKSLQKDTVYYVGTNDYLSDGGDNMNFFKKAVQKYDLDYKLRNILIDYFKQVDTIPVINDVRITVE